MTGDHSTISPGTDSTAGIIAFSSLDLDSTSTVDIKIGAGSVVGQPPIAGVDYDQLQVVGDGTVSLSGATLDLQAFGDGSTEPGTVYTLISNPSGSPVSGTFADLPQGATVTVGDIAYVISYQGGASGNDVTLTEVADTTTTVSSLTGPSSYGQTVTLEAHVVGDDTSLTPTGVVDFYLGEVLLGAATLDADGNAVLSSSALPGGSPEVGASYEGVSNFAASTGQAELDVAAVTPTVQLATAVSSTVLGQVATFTGSVLAVTPGSLVPTGTGTFYDETTDTTLAAGVPLVNGQAVLSIATLGVGSHTVRFTYDTGDDNYDANTVGATATQTVAQASTVTGIVSTASSLPFGQSVTFTVTVDASTPGAGVPAGQVTITDTDTHTVYGPFTLVNGMATWAVSDLGVGAHNLSVVFQPLGTDFAGSTASTSVAVTVAPTTIQLMMPTVAYTQSSVTLSAMVGGLGDNATGSVDFYDDGAFIGDAPVNASGVATLSVTDLAQGIQSFSATYNDPTDASHGSSTSSVGTLSVVPNPLTPVTVATTITVTPIYLPPPSQVPADFGGRITRLSFAVGILNPTPGLPTPTGTVTVYASGKAIGTYNLDAQGTTTIVLHGKQAYDKTIVVTYNGNVQGVTTFAPSSSTPFVADKAYFYANSPESSGSSSTAKKGVHPAGPAKFSKSVHKSKAEVSSVRGTEPKLKVRVLPHHSRG
jgi:trimeric autotransporter adhesin